VNVDRAPQRSRPSASVGAKPAQRAVGSPSEMTWTAWSNGAPSKWGSGYGFRLAVADRRAQFRRAWSTVTLVLLAGARVKIVQVPVSASFWGDCPELRHRSIGTWFRKYGWAPWPDGSPPRFQARMFGKAKFVVSHQAS